MVNKRGILRILEASIAVLIIFGVIISLMIIRKPSSEKDLSEIISPLLEEIAKNNSLREEIISNSPHAEESILTLIDSRIRELDINYTVKICEMEDICKLDSYPAIRSGNLYSGSRVISSSLNSGARSKRVSIFLWFRS